MSIKSPYTLTISLFTISILSGTVLSSAVFATDSNTAQDNVTVSVPVSCTMNGTGMTSHNANIPNGTYQADIGTTTLKTFCNDNQGFAIYAIGYTNEEYGNTTLIGATGGQTIVTGTATTTGNPDVSNWAVKLATDSTATYPLTLDNSFGSYSSVPSSYTKVAHRDSGTDLGSSATGAELTTTYAAYISKGQKADTYDGKVKFTLVHPSDTEAPTYPVACEAEKICYNANGGNVIGGMDRQDLVKARDWSSCAQTDYETYCYDSNDDEISISTLPELNYYIVPNLWASNFSRTGYGFAGWNTEFDYSGTTYGPNETITVPTNVGTNGLSLYAVWVNSTGTIQNWSSCSGLAQGAVTALTDSRDNNTYAVAKLADGKCWMIENLRLENTGTDNTSGSLAQGYNSSFIGLAAPETDNFSNSTTANSLYSTDGSTDAIISGSLQFYRFPRYNNFNTQSRQSSSSYSPTNNTYSYGNYYTWHAAIADTNLYSSGNYSTTSICPTGWHLPTGKDATGEFGLLDIALGGTGDYSDSSIDPTGVNISAYRLYPNNFIFSGVVNGSSVNGRNSYGSYQSASGNDYSAAYDLNFGSTYINPGTNINYKYNGRTVRCVSSV